MLNQDRTVRVRKAEEQARKALVEEREMRSQLDQLAKAHAQQVADLKKDLNVAEAESRKLHDAYTQIDTLQGDNQRLADAQAHLTAEATRMTTELAVAEAESRKLHDAYTQLDTLRGDNQKLADAQAHLTAETTRMTTELATLNTYKHRCDEDVRCTKDKNESLMQQLTTATADATRKQHELQTHNCTTRAETDTLRQVNADLSKQLAVSSEAHRLELTKRDEELTRLQSAASNTAQTNDLMNRIEQMRTESAGKDVRYELLVREHEVLKSKPAPSSTPLPPRTSVVKRLDSGTVTSTLPTSVLVQPSTLPRLVMRSNVKLMARTYAPIAGGPDTSNTDSNVFLQKVIGDFREFISPTLTLKQEARRV